MAGEIQIGGTTFATESGGTVTVSNVDSATNRTNLGLGSIATQAADSIDINGGAIDGTTIGGTTAAAGTFTTFTSTGIDDNASSTAITIDSSGNVTMTNLNATTITQSLSTAGYGTVSHNTSSASSGIYNFTSTLPSTANNTSNDHFRATTSSVNTWNLHGNGTSTFSSDERLKKNIETTRDGYLEDLARLRVVKYNWLPDEDSTPKELGLIAQEVEQVFPNLIHIDDIALGNVENPKAIKTSVLPYMLLKALQEAKSQIDALTARIEALETA